MVEFFQLENNELRIVAQVPGYTSHIIGSRNLDMALAGDFDGDGVVAGGDMDAIRRVRMRFSSRERSTAGAAARVGTMKRTAQVDALKLMGEQWDMAMAMARDEYEKGDNPLDPDEIVLRDDLEGDVDDVVRASGLEDEGQEASEAPPPG